MAIKKYCNRCGKELQSKEGHLIQLHSRNKKERDNGMLCADCIEDLRVFMAEKIDKQIVNDYLDGAYDRMRDEEAEEEELEGGN